MIDPLPFSEEEDRATAFGLRPINLGNNADPIYFGIAATNSVGDDEIIPFLDPAKESFLEYDLARLVYALANPKKPVVGLLSHPAHDRRLRPHDPADPPALGRRRPAAAAVRPAHAASRGSTSWRTTSRC